MSQDDSVAAFFNAWGMGDTAAQAAAIADVYTDTGRYADPRSDGVLTGPAAIATYVAAFAANAPGWTAKVVKSDRTADLLRVTVAFGGQGPDGSEMVQHGQYFARLDGSKIAELVGFVGTGAPE